MAASARWRVMLREPLVHFVAIGVVLFVAERLIVTRDEPPGGPRAPSVAEPETRRVAVTRAVREEIAASWTQLHEREPTAQELEAAIEQWIDDEVLYREGRRRGLEQDDPRVRARVAGKMAFVLREAVVVPEPSDAELRSWLEAHRDRYAEQERVDFTQVFVSGEDEAAQVRARELHAQLAAGASPTRMGEVFSGGRRYRRRTCADLARTFGERFAAGVRTQPLATWAIHPSRFGQHIVRVESRTAPGAVSFEALRPDLRHDWMEARRERETLRAVRGLRRDWDVVRE